jgi:outer membrane protein assembly factor BamB
MPSPGPRRLLRRVLIASAVLAVIIVAVVLVVALHSPGNVSHPNLSFTAPTSTAPKPPVKVKPKAAALFEWPRYGYDAGRTRDFDAPADLEPPFRVGWRFNDGALLEFSPVIYGSAMYVLDDDGAARSISTVTGHVNWMHKIGTLASASPAVYAKGKLVIFVLMSLTGHSPGGGYVDALSMKTGRTVWARPIPAGSESSPIVWGSTVYFGDEAGNVYSMNAGTGHTNWTYHATAAVKGGLSLLNGIVYFGDYAGRAYALRASNGGQVWAVSTDGAHFGFGSGNFYSTPAVAFGRVYMGNTDGRVYSFAARTGQLAWATSTGAYVYASPAVADVPGLGPTVYIGSYDGNFYAFNARSGAIRWSHPAGGRISGASTIVGNTVYYSDLGTKSTTGLNVRTGHVVFTYPDGAFTPIIADDSALFLDGYGEIYELLPDHKAAVHHAAAKPHRAAPKPRHGTARAARHVKRSKKHHVSRTSKRR